MTTKQYNRCRIQCEIVSFHLLTQFSCDHRRSSFLFLVKELYSSRCYGNSQLDNQTFSNILDTTLFHERNTSFNFKNVIMVLPYLNSHILQKMVYLKGRLIGMILKSML